MKDLQARHKVWVESNFPPQKSKVSPEVINKTKDAILLTGKMAHHALKARQGIRGDLSHHYMMFTRSAGRLIDAARNSTRAEFDVRVTGEDCWAFLDEPLLGVQEELGELFGCSFQDMDGRIDAVGDIVLYLMDYCNKSGIDFEDAVRSTAEKVHKRDWVANPVNGEAI